MSEYKRNYDVLKGLLNGKQVNTLTSQQIQSLILGKAAFSVKDSKRLYVLHDGCDIRKPTSSDMEYLGNVLSLNKQVIPSYKSMNSVAIDPDSQSLDLVYHELYSNKHPDFVSQKLIQKNTDDTILQLKQAVNSKILYQKSILESHNGLKSLNPSVKITHISDREYDDVEHFEFIDGLADEFITRIKLSRLSNESQIINTPKGKTSKRLLPIKLSEKRVFAHKSEYCLSKLTLNNKLYLRVRVRMEWEELKLDKKNYHILRIIIFNSDKSNM